MYWFITNVNHRVHDDYRKDSLPFTDSYDLALRNRLGLITKVGERKRFMQDWAQSAAEYTHEFRLLDDDGVIYFEGVCGDPTNCEAELAFAPLDWAADRYGCITMEFRPKGSKTDWEVL